MRHTQGTRGRPWLAPAALVLLALPAAALAANGGTPAETGELAIPHRMMLRRVLNFLLVSLSSKCKGFRPGDRLMLPLFYPQM